MSGWLFSLFAKTDKVEGVGCPRHWQAAKDK
jgi:hypothetical protein